MRISLFCHAVVFMPGSDNGVVDSEILKALNGVQYDEDTLVNYLDLALLDTGIVGGQVRFLFRPERAEAQIAIDYRAPRELTKKELTSLRDSTTGQLEDGIGECGFNVAVGGKEVEVHFAGGEMTLEQIEDGRDVRPAPRLPKAARQGDLEGIQDALAIGEDIDLMQAGFPALHLALLYAQREAALFLIERGAEVNALDMMGDDALSVAVTARELSDEATLEIARVLLARGASIADSQRLLDIAQAHGKVRTRELLFACGST